MPNLLYGLLLGIRLALPVDDELPGGPSTYSRLPEDLSQVGAVEALVGAGGLEAYLTADRRTMGLAGASVVPLLGALVDEHRQRLACILRASLDADGRPLRETEAGGYLGGESSTIMTHDGNRHYLKVGVKLQRIPHVHVWSRPEGAVAWVHTHHPARGIKPSEADLIAAQTMRRDNDRNLPLLVITPISVTAYWHGYTVEAVTLAGSDWWRGVDTGTCARVYRQPV